MLLGGRALRRAGARHELSVLPHAVPVHGGGDRDDVVERHLSRSRRGRDLRGLRARRLDVLARRPGRRGSGPVETVRLGADDGIPLERLRRYRASREQGQGGNSASEESSLRRGHEFKVTALGAAHPRGKLPNCGPRDGGAVGHDDTGGARNRGASRLPRVRISRTPPRTGCGSPGSGRTDRSTGRRSAGSAPAAALAWRDARDSPSRDRCS